MRETFELQKQSFQATSPTLHQVVSHLSSLQPASAIFRDNFVVYTNACFAAFGDWMRYWITQDKPNDYVSLAYASTRSPPGCCSNNASSYLSLKCTVGNSTTEPYIAAHNSLLALLAAVHLYKQEYQATQLERSPSQKELFLEAHTSKGYGKVSRGELSSFASSTVSKDLDVLEERTTEGSQTQASSKRLITSTQKKRTCKKDILGDLGTKASHNDDVLKRNLEEKDKEISRMHEELEKLKTLVASSQVFDDEKSSFIATTSMSTPNSCNQVSTLMVGQRVRILEMQTKRTVGLGSLLSLDPNFTLHTVPIGVGFAGVRVEEAFVKNALLFISSDEAQCLGDTVGLNVAWHTHYLCSL